MTGARPSALTRTARTTSFVVASFALHGSALAFAAYTRPPLPELQSEVTSVEFSYINDVGGGRVGNDSAVGDARQPPTPAPVTPVVRRTAESNTAKSDAPKPADTSNDAAPAAAPATEPSDAIVDASASTAGQGPTLSGSNGNNPDAVRAGAGGGGEGVDRRAAVRAWLRVVNASVQSRALDSVPRAAVRMGLRGRMRLGLTIDERGRVARVRVIQSTGHDILDAAAIATFEGTNVPPPPVEIAWVTREIPLPVSMVP